MLITPHSLVLPANLLKVHSVPLLMSLTKIFNRAGPKTYPWGHPWSPCRQWTVDCKSLNASILPFPCPPSSLLSGSVFPYGCFPCRLSVFPLQTSGHMLTIVFKWSQSERNYSEMQFSWLLIVVIRILCNYSCENTFIDYMKGWLQRKIMAVLSACYLSGKHFLIKEKFLAYIM